MNNMADNRSQSLVHWGLTRWPFRGTPAVDELYPTAGLTEALARIDYLVDGRRRVGLLTGESGVGKSLTLNAAALQLERHGRSVALVDATAVSAREFTWLVACGLGASPGEDADIARRAKKFGKVLFHPRFVMPTSGRRMKKQGFVKMAGIYFVNFFSIVFRGKPATKGYTDVR